MRSSLPTEDQEQRAVVAYCRLKGYKLHHSPNATGHSGEARRRAGRMKASGTSKGFPDLLIFTGKNRFAIEMKRRKGGRVTPEQREWLEFLAKHEFVTAVCHGAQEAIQLIEEIEQ